MSHEPTRRTVLTATVERRHEADALTARPGDAVLVHRGRARSLVMACPDGCGERLTVNLDPEAGPAWRAYQTPRGLTLYPSVWRESGCKSHFIVWHDQIIWCDRFEAGNREPEPQDPTLGTRIVAALGSEWKPYSQIAGAIEDIPWEVLRGCRTLTRRGQIEEGTGRHIGWFRRKP